MGVFPEGSGDESEGDDEAAADPLCEAGTGNKSKVKMFLITEISKLDPEKEGAWCSECC